MANKDSQKAIQEIDKLIEQLDDVCSLETGKTWHAKVYDTIDRYIPDGDLKATFRQLVFHVFKDVAYDKTISGRPLYKRVAVYNPQNKDYFINSLIHIKDYIKMHGISGSIAKSSKSNLVSGLSQLEFLTLVVTVIAAIGAGAFGIGFYFGTEKINAENIELKSDLKESQMKKNELQNALQLTNQKLKVTTAELDFKKKEVEATRKELQLYATQPKAKK